jgi:hypothetical protein
MERLPVTGATLTATSALGVGKVVEDAGNNQGVWVVGNARSAGAFSATVKLFTATPDIAGACAYASNYPPVGEYSSDAPMISFTGTPPYELLLAKLDEGSTTVKSGDTFLLPCDYTLTSFTDATGAPGRLNGTPFNDNVPRYAASTITWVYGGLTWSDVIQIPECNKETFLNSHSSPSCRSYTLGGKTRYVYNWTYVISNGATMCTSPWRVPTLTDFKVLVANSTSALLTTEWTLTGGWMDGITNPGEGWAWSSTEYTGSWAYGLAYGSRFGPQWGVERRHFLPVRCVK